MVYLLVTFFAVGILFGNLNALVMEPPGHAAGVGPALVGSLSTLISVPLGTLIGQGYNGTILPLIGGFALLSVLSIVVMRWAEAGRSGAWSIKLPRKVPYRFSKSSNGFDRAQPTAFRIA